MKMVAIGLAAAMFVAAGMVGQARADDYMALCKASEKDNADADKLCTCAAGKIKPEDKDAAMKALKIIDDALSQGKTPDPSSMPEDLTKGMQAQTEAEAACM